MSDIISIVPFTEKLHTNFILDVLPKFYDHHRIAEPLLTLLI